MASSSSLLSRDELRQLVTTRFVPKPEEIDLEKVEILRAGCSVLQPISPRNEDNHIERVDGEDGIVLEEDHRAIHRIDETPKLVTKRVHSSVIPIRDEAIKVLRNLQTTPAESLREERYDFYSQRWFHTT
uniref:Uncharacterized protein n=1 Tax=Caenorhabditis japonica TaxID=281687 RepID=A0A8R1ELE0_CAEJA